MSGQGNAREQYIGIPPIVVGRRYSAKARPRDYPWPLDLYRVRQLAEELGLYGEGQTICAVDSGADRHHVENGALSETGYRRVTLRNFTGRGDANDQLGHGTHVAAIAAGLDMPEMKIRGIAPRANLLIGKALGDDGTGSDRSVADAIRWGVDEGATIINCSLGANWPSPRIIDAAKYAADHGVALICAAGNDGMAEGVDYPGASPNAQAVGAHGESWDLAIFSDRGPQVVIAAPGVKYRSAYLRGGQAELSGTSMASPFVSGALALIAEATGIQSWTPEILDDVFRMGATDRGAPGRDPHFGYGTLDLSRLLRRAPQPAPVPGDWQVEEIEHDGRRGLFVYQ